MTNDHRPPTLAQNLPGDSKFYSRLSVYSTCIPSSQQWDLNSLVCRPIPNAVICYFAVLLNLKYIFGASKPSATTTYQEILKLLHWFVVLLAVHKRKNMTLREGHISCTSADIRLEQGWRTFLTTRAVIVYRLRRNTSRADGNFEKKNKVWVFVIILINY
jgi:hypothetical protein